MSEANGEDVVLDDWAKSKTRQQQQQAEQEKTIQAR
jgi:hypothetical protein